MIPSGITEYDELEETSKVLLYLREVLLNTTQLDLSKIAPHLAALIYLRWADFEEAEQEAVAAFDGTSYEAVLDASLHWRSWHDLPPRELHRVVSQQLADKLMALGNARHSALATYLHRLGPVLDSMGKNSPETLSRLVGWLAKQPFETITDRRRLLRVYDSLLEHDMPQMTSEWRTPAVVAKLLADIAAPTPSNRIYDPCFGTASLLTAAADCAANNSTQKLNRLGQSSISVSGIEKNPNSFVIGLTRLVLSGITEPKLELGDSLERFAPGNLSEEGFDLVIANPPWASKAQGHGMDHFPVKTGDVTGLFIQHALSQLKPSGRAVFIVPQGFLFRGGSGQQLRRFLVEQNTVQAVVSLPPSLFMPNTAVKSSILVVQRGGTTERIRMVDAEPYFHKGPTRRPATLSAEMSKELVECISGLATGKHSWDVEIDVLSSAEWDLTPRRREATGLDGILETLRSKVKIVPLTSCCRVTSGRGYKTADLIEDLPDDKKSMRSSAVVEPDIDAVIQALRAIDVKEQDKIRAMDLQLDKLVRERDEASKREKQLAFLSAVVPEEMTPSEVPLIRIKDIQRNQAAQGSAKLIQRAAAEVDTRWKLKSGDVLLSKSGTIGKAGIVRNGAVGAVAAGGLYVLRVDQDVVNPHYLMAYLASAECRMWLQARARGAIIMSLSKAALDSLQIPLPALPIQQRVADAHRDHGVDALAYLSQLLVEGENDPVSSWIDGALQHMTSERALSIKASDLEPALHQRVLGDDLRIMRNRYVHGGKGEHALAPWVMAVAAVAEALQDVKSIPRSPALFSLMQRAAQMLDDAETKVVGHLPIATKARELTRGIKERFVACSSELLASVNLAVSCKESVVRQGQPTRVELSVENGGVLPLRDVTCVTEPDWGQANIGYVAESSTKAFVVSGVPPKDQATMSLSVRWRGISLDGQQVEGQRELAFQIVESLPVQEIREDFGASPYVCGSPITPDRADVFVGREEILDQIRRQVMRRGNVVLLEGNRRAGKSSILRHLEGPHAVPGWMGVYSSLQAAEGSSSGRGVPTVEVFRTIAGDIAKCLQKMGVEVPLPNGDVLSATQTLGVSKACREGISEESAFSDFREYTEVVLNLLNQHDMGLLLMLDEFDKLQEGIDSGITSPQVPENFRYLVQTYPRFSAILTGSRRLKRLRMEYWSALYGLGTRFGVTSLSDVAAERLITEPVKGRLTYSSEGMKRAVYLAAGQPFLLQCLCNRVFDMAAQLRIRSITIDHVNQASIALVEDNEHFASLWDYTELHRRRLLLAVCHQASSTGTPLTLGAIQDFMVQNEIEISDDILVADLDFLRELELIAMTNSSDGASYGLAIPLMGIWMDKQLDFNALLAKARIELEEQHG